MDYFPDQDQLSASTEPKGETDNSFKALRKTGALNLTEETINSVIESNEVVFIMSCIDFNDKEGFWDEKYVTFFDIVADQVKEEFPQVGKIALGKINCEHQDSLAERFNIGYYPEFALIRNGVLVKKRYSDSITVEKLTEYIRKELEDPIREFKDITDLEKLDLEKRMFIGFFNSKIDPEYTIFRKAASNYKPYCQFRAGFGEIVAKIHQLGKPGLVLWYRDMLSNKKEDIFTGSLQSYKEVNDWMSENYIPFVRKLGPYGFEDLVTGDFPYLLLYHKPQDKEIVIKFTNICESTLMNFKNKVIFLTSDNEQYIPYFYLPKTKRPIILFQNAMSFRYIFNDIQEMEVPGKLVEFIDDLNCDSPRDNGEAPNLTEETINETIESNEIVFIMFFDNTSPALALRIVPWFNRAAQQIKAEFPQVGQVILAKVDVATQGAITKRFGFSRYPGLGRPDYPIFLVVRNGQCLRNRYKGRHTVEEVVKFIKQQWADWKYIEAFPDFDDFPPLDPLL